MTGVWLIRISRLLLHEDTFELMVAPAIADLQCGPTAGAYAAVWTSMAGALTDDFTGDIRYVCEDIVTLMGLIAIQATYYSGMLLLLVAGMTTTQIAESLATGGTRALSAVIVFVFALSALPTMLCFWPPRRVRDSEPPSYLAT
jgi:hypothetical protein